MSLEEKVQHIFSTQEIQRLKLFRGPDGISQIVTDVHGMKVRQARLFLTNLINLVRCPLTITVIHGYKHGAAILNLVRYELRNRHIISRITDIHNPGITYLTII